MTTFDKSSGVVYTETTSAPVKSMVNGWATQARGKRRHGYRPKNSGRGVSKLREISLRSCVHNIDLFTPEALNDAGSHYAGIIYRECCKQSCLSFNNWDMFLKVIPSEVNEHHTFNVSKEARERNSAFQVPSVSTRLARLNIDTITFLCLHELRLHVEDLMGITPIASLRGLVIEQRERLLSNQVLTLRNVKDWAKAVETKGAFGHLAVLSMSILHIPSRDLLDVVMKFPALSLFGSTDLEWSCFTDPVRIHRTWISLDGDNKYRGFSQSDLQSLWSSRNMTISQKIRKLYELNRRWETDAKIPFHSVAVIDGLPASTSDPTSVHWYVRELQNLALRPNKHIDETRSGTQEPTMKKRKIRDGKQLNLRDALGGLI